VVALAAPQPSTTVPCVFNKPFVSWTGAASQCQPQMTVSCATSADCANLPGACCPHYGPGTGSCAGLHCLKDSPNATEAFCGVPSQSSGGAHSSAGECVVGSEYPFCGFCHAGACGAGNAMCASESMCSNPSPSVSLTCYKEGHAAPAPTALGSGAPLTTSNCSSPLDCCSTPSLPFLCNRSAVCKCEEGGACFTSQCGTDGCCRPW